MFEDLFEKVSRIKEIMDYSIIDEDIRDLVKHFNDLGFRTYSACSGHSYKDEPIATAIGFTGHYAKVSKLIDFIESLNLNLDWEVDRRHPKANSYMLQLKFGLYGDRSLESNEETIVAVYEDIQKIDTALDEFEKG